MEELQIAFDIAGFQEYFIKCKVAITITIFTGMRLR